MLASHACRCALQPKSYTVDLEGQEIEQGDDGTVPSGDFSSSIIKQATRRISLQVTLLPRHFGSTSCVDLFCSVGSPRMMAMKTATMTTSPFRIPAGGLAVVAARV